jgi:hypothetical protein
MIVQSANGAIVKTETDTADHNNIRDDANESVRKRRKHFEGRKIGRKRISLFQEPVSSIFLDY